MFDPTGMYPKGFHPVKLDRSQNFKRKATAFTRTQRPPRYYFINLGRCETREDHAANPPRGDAPASSNPFYADVYSLGKLVDKEFVKVRSRISRLTVSNLFPSLIPSEIPRFQVHGSVDY